MRYNTKSAEVLNEADRFEDILNFQLFVAEQDARLWSGGEWPGDDWVPGTPIHPLPRRVDNIHIGESWVEGNVPRPMAQYLAAVERFYPIYCWDCEVGWPDITEPCWNCGKELAKPRPWTPKKIFTDNPLNVDVEVRESGDLVLRGAGDVLSWVYEEMHRNLERRLYTELYAEDFIATNTTLYEQNRGAFQHEAEFENFEFPRPWVHTVTWRPDPEGAIEPYNPPIFGLDEEDWVSAVISHPRRSGRSAFLSRWVHGDERAEITVPSELMPDCDEDHGEVLYIPTEVNEYHSSDVQYFGRWLQGRDLSGHRDISEPVINRGNPTLERYLAREGSMTHEELTRGNIPPRRR